MERIYSLDNNINLLMNRNSLLNQRLINFVYLVKLINLLHLYLNNARF